VAVFQQGRHTEAGQLISAALALNPANAPAHNNLANALFAQDRLEEAIAGYRRALELDPGYADARTNLAARLSNLAGRLSDLGRPDEAVAHCKEALALRPELAEAHNNLGNAHQARGDIDAAEASYRRALELKPDFAAAKVNLGLSRLLRGDYAAGLPLFESRFVAFGRVPFDAAQRWSGEKVRRKSLLLWSEQGLGDSIMMIRYLPLLKERGFERVIIYTHPALVRLLGGVSSREPAPAFDLHCPMMSLPLVFGSRLETIPAKVPYLKIEASKKLKDLPSRKVGISWAGTKENRKNALRSLRLAQLAPLFDVPGVSFVSLQKGDGAEELAGAPWKITNRMDECADLADTAALIGELDLVITVDTAIAHLAGALGKPVWMLNRFESEWRWLRGREDSPWYPTLRLFNQPKLGDWATPIARIAAALKETPSR